MDANQQSWYISLGCLIVLHYRTELHLNSHIALKPVKVLKDINNGYSSLALSVTNNAYLSLPSN